MRDLWGENISKRRNLNIFLEIFAMLIVCSISVWTIFYNRHIILSFFKDIFKKENECVTEYKPIGNQEFDSLFLRLNKLEELSFNYNKNDYKVRALRYLSYGTLNGDLSSSVDADFIKYVKENQGEYKITDFINDRPNEKLTFTIPNSSYEIDLYHLTNVLCNSLNKDQESIDYAGWAGDLIVFTKDMLDGKYTIDNFSEDNTACSKAILNASLDAANILNNYENSNYISLANCCGEYYKSLTHKKRLEIFKFHTLKNKSNGDDIFKYLTEPEPGNELIFNKLQTFVDDTNGITYDFVVIHYFGCIMSFSEYIN